MFGGAGGGFRNSIVLEIILAHIFVTIVPAHTFDARIGEVLTRVKEFRAALAASQLAWSGGRERGLYLYDVNCCSAFFQMSFSGSVDGSFESAVLAMVRSGGMWRSSVSLMRLR